MARKAIVVSENSVTTKAARKINDAHRVAISVAASAMTAAIERAIEVGRLLAEEKAKHEHGKWIPWIEENLEFNRKQAAAYTRAYEHRKELSNVQPGKTFDGGLKGALKLLSKPRDAKKKSKRLDCDAEEDTGEIDAESSLDDYKTAFRYRASNAIELASYTKGPVDDDIVMIARHVAEAWSKLADKLETEK